ncbi:MAG TPA: FKBP-type peptidyl-prolyl cis-trans isomerase [Terracidiphilus sp.]|jgi:peptidylprolyl isomerase
MNSRFLLFSVAAALAASVSAQTAPLPAPKAAAKPASATTASAASSAVKLPPGLPPAHGIVHTAVSLKYQDIKVGTGPVGEDKQLWKVKYTGWRAADGVKFDSWDEHKMPVMENGKPKLGADGKPVLGEAEPMEFPHGVGRMIPGFDLGIEGMRVGGKRRVFVPWVMAYGYRAIPDRGDKPGIPAQSDLIFDVELVSVAPLPAPPQPAAPRPGTPPVARPTVPGAPSTSGQPAAPGAPSTAPTTPPVPQPHPATPPGTAPQSNPPSTPQSN